MATSAFMIILSELQFVGSEISIDGVKLTLDKNVIVGFATVFLLYFVYVFMLRMLEFSFATRIETLKGNLEKLQKDYEEARSDAVQAQTLYDSKHEMEHFISFEEFARRHAQETEQLSERVRLVKLSAYTTIDVLFPLLLAMLAFWKAGSLWAAFGFLF
ncbi:hypothetical protein ASG50_25435 [Rhizobium sp. Leaf386]|nr:hypothetical protein ASG50_25435 [Rhizobium sp. Leaf386]